MSFYAAALRTMVELSKTFRDDPTRYESLLHKCLAYMNGKLFNGEYFIQEIRWTDLQVPDPTKSRTLLPRLFARGNSRTYAGRA